MLDFKRLEIKRPDAYTATSAIAKRTTIVVAILVMVVRLGGFKFRNGIFTLIACIAARQRCEYHQVKSPYCEKPFH
ncbi:hypothetical protein DRF68_04165 [Candidatus Chryseobacterium massiliae]|uniref:Uncharacterized protein n=1 Tax=Candidatus Chryseobacterium massiliense TaxID=204089 RepID=A0A3D9BF90_9FLAO|nr:hypothetical protein DRF68_04165 [Candidatus Chryseobacterium massiliae]